MTIVFALVAMALRVAVQMTAWLIGGIFGLVWWAIERLHEAMAAEIDAPLIGKQGFDLRDPTPMEIADVPKGQVPPPPPAPPGRTTVRGYHKGGGVSWS